MSKNLKQSLEGEAAMSKDELLIILKQIEASHDTEHAHVLADEALVSYIDDSEIKTAYEKLEKWYA